MRWNCPHCGTLLAIADSSALKRSADRWQLSACYRCGGFSMVQHPITAGHPSVTLNAPRILQAQRNRHEIRQALSTLSATPPPPPPVARSATPPHPGAPSAARPALHSAPSSPPADFSAVRARIQESRSARHRSTPAPHTVATARNRERIHSLALGALLFMVVSAGGMLALQGVRVKMLAAQSDITPSAPASVGTDRIENRTAAPERDRVQVDLSEPGMRYEILNRNSAGQPAHSSP